MDRRQLCRGALMLAAARFVGGGWPASAILPKPRLTRDPFALGVASGDPCTQGFVLWTRLAGVEPDAVVGYEIASDPGFRRIVRQGKALAPRGRGHSVHVPVAGLEPGRHWFYRFHLGEAVSRTGQTMTMSSNPDRLRLALNCCQHWEHGWFTAYRDMIAQGADIAVQVGDYIYEVSFGNGPDVRRFGAPEPYDLAEYRDRHALYCTDADLAEARARLPFVVTWDDHDVENDYAGFQGVETADPVRFRARRAAAYQAWFEHMPLDPARLLADGEIRLYRRLRFGALATMHVLDSRQYRTPHPCLTAEHRGGQIVRNCAEVTDPDATMLGAAQEAWLRDGFGRETATWTLLTQQTLFSRLFLPDGPEAYYSDIWDGYVATRDRTVAALRQPTVRNAVVLSGDVHSFWVNDVKTNFADGRSPVIGTEVVTTCLASRNAPEALFAGALSRNPHVRFLDNRHSGYALIEVTPRSLVIDLRAVRDLTDPAGTCHSLPGFVVEAGKPGAVAA